MRSDWKITFFKPDIPGIFPILNGIRFAAEFSGDEECGIILDESNGAENRLPFAKEGKRGLLYGMQIVGEGVLKCRYHFYQGNDIYTDPYATAVSGLEKWGEATRIPRSNYGYFDATEFDWEDDAPLEIPFEDSNIYGVNVRAFTMHKSSGVRHKGTFEGIVEKIPYLKALGITAIELMPCYEYEECMPCISYGQVNDFSPEYTKTDSDKKRINCWGFQSGCYFSPKASFSAGKSPQYSFKSMVRKLHQNGIEVMMHFYFPPTIKQLYMLQVLKFWVNEYHIDGFRLSGFHIPIRLLAEDAALRSTKIRISYLTDDELQVADNTGFKNFAIDSLQFKNDMRRFLKGDEGLANQVLNLQRLNHEGIAVINYLADYDGFSLYDCVSYEKKHNTDNGENNRDGVEINYTWNCGIEGDTRKKSVTELRLKQLKNALSFLFLSQGTPFLFSGDEFANTRFGNNNVYCQDNDTGWIKWKDNRFSNEILTYTKFLISLRKANRILHLKEPLKVMDSRGLGYPDISYHGTEAWRPDLSYISRMVGIMLCGQYANASDASFYFVFNMHWEPHRFALPKLPKGSAWIKLADTSQPSENKEMVTGETHETETLVTLDGRTVAIYQSIPYLPPKQSRNKKKKLTQAKEKRQNNESLETF